MKTHLESTFLGAFVKSQKATISFVISVRLSAWKNSVPNELIFMKFDTWVFLGKYVDKIQVSL
jgi:hypothetical protein